MKTAPRAREIDEMCGEIDEAAGGRLEQVAPRALRLLGAAAREYTSGSVESTGVRSGPPDARDERGIADWITAPSWGPTPTGVVDRDASVERGNRDPNRQPCANAAAAS